MEFKIGFRERPSKFQCKVISENCLKFEPLVEQKKKKERKQLNNFVVTSSHVSVLYKIKDSRVQRVHLLHCTRPILTQKAEAPFKESGD